VIDKAGVIRYSASDAHAADREGKNAALVRELERA